MLYVGISKSHVARLAQHQEVSGWYWDIARITVQHFESREEALFAEAVAIFEEKPLHNLRAPIRSEAELFAKALAACHEPPVERHPDGHRALGYLRTKPQRLLSGIRRLRKAGVPDGLIFADFGNAAIGKRPNFIRVMQLAQISGTRIFCGRLEEFEPAADILSRRGAIVHHPPELTQPR